ISLYYISMKKFGFFISTSIFMPISMYLSKQKNIILIIGVTLFLEIFIYLLFVMQLGLRMP
ncbi:MAG: tripartite tricarboxylate transporter TctB family protein, partial [Peptoniphilus grossensis]